MQTVSLIHFYTDTLSQTDIPLLLQVPQLICGSGEPEPPLTIVESSPPPFMEPGVEGQQPAGEEKGALTGNREKSFLLLLLLTLLCSLTMMLKRTEVLHHPNYTTTLTTCPPGKPRGYS